MDYIENNQEKLQSILQEIVNRDYDYIYFIDAKNGSFHRCAYSEKCGHLPERSGNDYSGSCQQYHSFVAYPEDFQILSRNTNLSYVEAILREKVFYEFTARIKNTDGTIGHKKYGYSYLNREQRLLLMTRKDVSRKVLKDRNQKEVLERALQSAEQANLVKNSFLSRMSHEIRTPMNVIFGMCSLAAQSVNRSEEVLDYLTKIEISGQYLLTLLNDILDMSRLESGKIRLCNSNFVFSEWIGSIHTLIGSQARDKHIQYITKISEDGNGTYIADAIKLKQVLVNILGNAIKFTPEQGTIIFSAAVLSRKQNQVWMEFKVCDNGCGIREESLNRIFEPFEQQDDSFGLKYGGVGMGLAISKNLLDLMGGTISIKSVFRKGTEVTVDVPLEIGENTTDIFRKSQYFLLDGEEDFTLESEEKEIDFTGKRFLLAEDHLLNAEVAVRLLEKRGACVTVAGNGLKAMEYFSTKPAYYYDAILMDVRMPVMDGLQAAYNIRRWDREDAASIPIIAMTANVFEEDVERSRDAGMDAHLTKPIDPDRMFLILQRLLNRKKKD